MLKEHNTKLLLKLEVVQSFSINAEVIRLQLSVGSAGFCPCLVPPSPPPYLKYFLKITKVGKLHSWFSVSNIYMFLQKWGEECWDVHIDANKHLGTDQTIECRKVLAIKEYACRSRHKRREEYIFYRKRRGGRRAGSQQGKDGVVLFNKQFSTSKGSLLVRSDSWHREKKKSNKTQKVIQALAYGGGVHSSPCQPHIMQSCWGREALPLSATKYCHGPAGQRTQTSFVRARSPLSTCVKQLKAMRGLSAPGRPIEQMSWFAAADMATWLKSILLVGICYLQACAAGEGGSIQCRTS